MKKSIKTGLAGVAAEILYAIMFAAIGLLITWICWLASV
jgi:hypothetical protein